MAYSFEMEASEISDYHADMLDMAGDDLESWREAMDEQGDEITLAEINGAGVYAGAYQPTPADYGYFWNE